jgi:hypothetical protein
MSVGMRAPFVRRYDASVGPYGRRRISFIARNRGDDGGFSVM